MSKRRGTYLPTQAIVKTGQAMVRMVVEAVAVAENSVPMLRWCQSEGDMSAWLAWKREPDEAEGGQDVEDDETTAWRARAVRQSLSKFPAWAGE